MRIGAAVVTHELGSDKFVSLPKLFRTTERFSPRCSDWSLCRCWGAEQKVIPQLLQTKDPMKGQFRRQICCRQA